MTIADWLIVAVLLLSVIAGLTQGFFRSVFGLGGLIIGLLLAAWNYRLVAAPLMSVIRVESAADMIAFLIIALLVMGICGLVGAVLHKMFKKIGLGCLDRLAGGVFGFLQGMLLVTVCILVAVAFFPQSHWLFEARLPRYFFGACNVGAGVTPSDLGERIRDGLKSLEQQSPPWMHAAPGRQ